MEIRDNLDIRGDGLQVALRESKKAKAVYQTDPVRAQDRLTLLSQMSRLRKIISESLRTLSPLENPVIAGQYTSEDLEEINGHLRNAVIDLKKMLESFLSQAMEKTERYQLAV